MTQRKWLAECHAWLDDPTSVEFNDFGNWVQARDLRANPIRDANLTWRIKPKTLSINGREFEAPVPIDDGEFLIEIVHWGTMKRVNFYHATPEARDLHYKILVEESTPK
jgi:hypothetical protein